MFEEERTCNLEKDWKGNALNKIDDELIEMLGLDEIIDNIDKAKGVRWYGHVLRREASDALQRH